MDQATSWEHEVRALISKASNEELVPKALRYYQEALNLLPPPIEDSSYSTQIYSAIGELYFLNGDYDQSFHYFSEAIRCKDALGLAHIHLRLGQLRFKRGEIERAKDELMRAYMASGMIIFQGEDAKYYGLIENIIKKHRP